MSFQPAVDCVEIVINATSFAKPIANVMNAHFPAGYLQAQLDQLASDVNTAVAALYLPYLATTVNYQNVTVRGLTSSVDLISINSDDAGPGTDIATPNPNNVTLCFRANTGFTGRSARGRFYAMPATIGQMDDANNFKATYAAGIVDMLEGIQAACLANSCVNVVLSRFNGGAPRVAALPIEIIAWDFRNRTVDSQRGRLTAGH